MSIFLILTGSTLYTWFKSRSGPPPQKADAEREKGEEHGKPLLSTSPSNRDIEKGMGLKMSVERSRSPSPRLR